MIEQNKKNLRNQLIKKRRLIENRTEKDISVFQKLIENEKVKNADNILIYISYNDETDTAMLLDYLLSENKNVYAPKCSKNGQMKFFLIKSSDELQKGAYGIPEPTGEIEPVITERTVCIVPAVSFTEIGCRLGYGGGYYDRFLSKNPMLFTIGICYEDLISETLPCAEHDVKVKAVITEERTVYPIAKG